MMRWKSWRREGIAIALLCGLTALLAWGGRAGAQTATMEQRTGPSMGMTVGAGMLQAREIEGAREAIRKAFMTQQYERVLKIHEETKSRFPTAQLNVYYLTMAQSRLTELRARQAGVEPFKRLETKPASLNPDSPSLSEPEVGAATPGTPEASQDASGSTNATQPAPTAQEPPPAPTGEAAASPLPEQSEGTLIPVASPTAPPTAQGTPASESASTEVAAATPAGAATQAAAALADQVAAAKTPQESGREVAALMSPAPPAAPVVPLPAPPAVGAQPINLKGILFITMLVLAGLGVVTVLLVVMRRRPAAEGPLTDAPRWTPDSQAPEAPVQRTGRPAETEAKAGPRAAPPASEGLAAGAVTENRIDFDENLYANTQPEIVKPHREEPETSPGFNDFSDVDISAPFAPTSQSSAAGADLPTVEMSVEDIHEIETLKAQARGPAQLEGSPFANLFGDQTTARGPAPTEPLPTGETRPVFDEDDIWHAPHTEDEQPVNLEDLPSAPQGEPQIVDRDVISLGADQSAYGLPAPEQEDDWLASLSPRPAEPIEALDLPTVDIFSTPPERAATQAMPEAEPVKPMAPALPLDADVSLPPAHGAGTGIGPSEITKTAWDENYERTAELSHPGARSDSGLDLPEVAQMQAFHHDETVRVDLGPAPDYPGDVTAVSSMRTEMTVSPVGLHIHPDAIDSPNELPVTEAGPMGLDLFDREFRQGMGDLEAGNWGGAVHHLSIAAALRPEAQEVKEQLREARRRKNEG